MTLQESKAGIAYTGNIAIVWIARRPKTYVYHKRILCELVEVRYASHEHGRWCGNSCEAA